MDRQTLKYYVGLRKDQVERGMEARGDKAGLVHSISVGNKDDAYAEDKAAFLRDRANRLRRKQGELLGMLLETPADEQVLSRPQARTERDVTFLTRDIVVPDLGNFILFSGMTTFENGDRDHHLYVRPATDLIRAIVRSQDMRDNLHLAGFAPRTLDIFGRDGQSVFWSDSETAGPNIDIDVNGGGFVDLAPSARAAHLEDSVETLEVLSGAITDLGINLSSSGRVSHMFPGISTGRSPLEVAIAEIEHDESSRAYEAMVNQANFPDMPMAPQTL